MRIDNTGKIGINTGEGTAPADWLHINTTGSNNTGIKLKTTANGYSTISGDANREAADNYLLRVVGKWNATEVSQITFESGGSYASGKNDGEINFWTKATSDNSMVERLCIEPGGDVRVKTGNLEISTNNQGIDFKAVSGSNSTSELLDDYEEGLWDLTGGSCNVDLHDNYDTGWYVKVGHLVTVGAYVQSDETSTDSSTNLQFTLPFATSAVPTGGDGAWVGSASLNSFALDTDVTQTTIAAGDATFTATIRLNGGYAVGWTTLKKNQFTDAKLMQFTLTYKCQ
tara:strand:- start:392 stop:1246 length:855 start_codon:yes stop_codon:yes gene_type:complete